jgi:hypothetical protein
MPWSRPVVPGCLLGALTLVLSAESDARAQLNAGPTATDSAAVLRQARKAQRKFEEARRAYLPRTDGGGSSSECDARIGRFCYWYSDAPSNPPAEPPRIAEARDVLLGELEEAARLLPGDDWIAGQRARYLVEQHRPDLALAAARECRSTHWWCAALAGYALHAAGKYGPADSAYADALAAMPADERCRWTDLSNLLDEDAGRYRKLKCDERSEANARIWWLSDPLLTLPGNDLRTEHFARLTVARTLQGADTPHGIGVAPDMEELIVRYGWSESWSQPWGRPLHAEEPSVVGYERTPSFWFFAAPPLPPPLDSKKEEARTVIWDLARFHPTARYAPRYASAFGAIGRAQIARFRRDTGAVIVAAYDVRGDTLLLGGMPDSLGHQSPHEQSDTTGPGLHVALAAARDPGAPPAVGRYAEAAAGVLKLEAPWMPPLVSLEARVVNTRRVARARVFALDAETPSSLALSDLLLVRAVGDSVADSLPAVMPRALLAPEVPAGSHVGLYWEIYGAPASDPVAVEVRVEQGGGAREAGGWLGTHDCATPSRVVLRVTWKEMPLASPRPPGRSVVLDLSRLEPRHYVLSVAATAGSGVPACAGRALEIKRR